ncbi:MAG: peptidylprolyl isomerase [Ignavibacteriales bacterium]|nr:peptidylprolyl isomerase [Ignavibacteriales bacterium]
MRKTLFSLLMCSFLFILISCSTEKSSIVVSEFGNEKLTLGEFEKAYQKHTGGLEKAKQDSISQYKNFLDLYINFKMKVKDADERGLAYDPSIVNEYESYKKQVGVSYLIEKRLIEPAVKEMYERRKIECRVSHIMIVPNDMTQNDAYNLTQSIIDSIKAGGSFNKFAEKYSDDNYSKVVGGDIYYITSGQVPYEFEDAVYETAVNDVYPKPIKTVYGYHVIKVTDRIERKESIKAKHILVDFKDENGNVDSAAAYKQIESYRMQILNGADFSQMAVQFSEDKYSGVNGGDLGFFQRRQMVQPFDYVAFRLPVGELSEIVKTDYGYHLIQVEEIAPMLSFEKQLPELKNLYKQTRYDDDKVKFVEQLKVEMNYKLEDGVIEKIANLNDSVTFSDEYWTSDFRNKANAFTIFTINAKPFILDSIVNNTISVKTFTGKKITKDLLNSALDDYLSNLLFEEKAQILDKSDEGFAELMNDYKNGLYIFKLQEEEVWNKLELDSIKIYNLYLETKEKYNWPDRVNYSEIFSRTDSLIQNYYQRILNGEEFDSIATNYTEKFNLRSKAGNYGFVDVNADELSKLADELEVGSISEPKKVKNGFAIIKLFARDPMRPKTFEEARAEVSSQYQEMESKRLEEDYINRLKSYYQPKYYYEELNKAFKE